MKYVPFLVLALFAFGCVAPETSVDSGSTDDVFAEDAFDTDIDTGSDVDAGAVDEDADIDASSDTDASSDIDAGASDEDADIDAR